MPCRRMLELMLCLFFIFLCSQTGLAQNATSSSSPQMPASGFFQTVGGDIGYVFASPFHLSRRSGLHLLAFTALTLGTIAYVDEPFDEEYAKEGHDAFYVAHKLAQIGQFYDDVSPIAFAAGLSATTLAAGLISKDKKLLTTTRLMVESSIMTLILTETFKGVMGRSRPYTDRGAHDFNFFKFSSDQGFQSMPSGHVSSAFAIMTVMAKQYDHWWVEIPAYTFCAGVAFQRMESRSHWLSDTIVGGGLGYWVGSTLVRHSAGVTEKSLFRPYWLGNRLSVTVSF